MLAARKVSKMNLGQQPNEIALQGLHAINAVCSFSTSNSELPSPLDTSGPLSHQMTNAILSNHEEINSLCQEIRSFARGANASDTDDDNSVSTNDTDGSITAAVHALRQHSSRYSSGRNSDFRSGQR